MRCSPGGRATGTESWLIDVQQQARASVDADGASSQTPPKRRSRHIRPLLFKRLCDLLRLLEHCPHPVPIRISYQLLPSCSAMSRAEQPRSARSERQKWRSSYMSRWSSGSSSSLPGKPMLARQLPLERVPDRTPVVTPPSLAKRPTGGRGEQPLHVPHRYRNASARDSRSGFPDPRDLAFGIVDLDDELVVMLVTQLDGDCPVRMVHVPKHPLAMLVKPPSGDDTRQIRSPRP